MAPVTGLPGGKFVSAPKNWTVNIGLSEVVTRCCSFNPLKHHVKECPHNKPYPKKDLVSTSSYNQHLPSISHCMPNTNQGHHPWSTVCFKTDPRGFVLASLPNNPPKGQPVARTPSIEGALSCCECSRCGSGGTGSGGCRPRRGRPGQFTHRNTRGAVGATAKATKLSA